MFTNLKEFNKYAKEQEKTGSKWYKDVDGIIVSFTRNETTVCFNKYTGEQMAA